jgi:hypothetical protein
LDDDLFTSRQQRQKDVNVSAIIRQMADIDL